MENVLAFLNFKTIGKTTVDLIKGLRVTLKYLFSPAITYLYPKQKKPLCNRFRGVLAFHPELCISCEMCVRVCPSDVISLEWVRNPTTQKKDLVWFQIDYGRCNVCGLCEEVCPTPKKAIHHTLEFELVFHSRKDFLTRWTVSKENVSSEEVSSQPWYRFVPYGLCLPRFTVSNSIHPDGRST